MKNIPPPKKKIYIYLEERMYANENIKTKNYVDKELNQNLIVIVIVIVILIMKNKFRKSKSDNNNN